MINNQKSMQWKYPNFQIQCFYNWTSGTPDSGDLCKSLGSLCSVVKGLIVSGAGQTDQGTGSPIALSVDS